jgi:transcriptional regulator with XRE-family HTH domain
MTAGVGERLKAARERRGLSRPEVARRADVSPNLVANVERGEYVNGVLQPYKSTERTLAKLALVVGEDPVEIVRAAGLDPDRIPWDTVDVGRDGAGSGVMVVLVGDKDSPEAVGRKVEEALAQLRREQGRRSGK